MYLNKQACSNVNETIIIWFLFNTVASKFTEKSSKIYYFCRIMQDMLIKRQLKFFLGPRWPQEKTIYFVATFLFCAIHGYIYIGL